MRPALPCLVRDPLGGESAISVAGCPTQRLFEPGLYVATIAEVRRYGTAALVALREQSAEAMPLAVWLHESVVQAAAMVALRLPLEASQGLVHYEAQVTIVVRGRFQKHPKAQRLSLDVMSAENVHIGRP